MSVRQLLEASAGRLSGLGRSFPFPATAVADRDGRILAASDPVRLPSLQAAARAVVDFFSIDLRAGDVVVTNDPFLGGSCINEFTLVADAGNALGIARLSVVDIGGMHYGNISPDSFDIWGEGARFTPLKIRTDDGVRNQAFELLRLNSREPALLERALSAMAREAEAMAGIDLEPNDREVERAHTALATLAPSSRDAEEPIRVPGREDGPIVRLTLDVSDDGVRFDFARSDKQIEFPVNSTQWHTTDCCLAVLQQCLPGFTPSSEILERVSVEAGEGRVTGAALPAIVALSPFVTARAIRTVAVRLLAAAGAPTTEPDPWWETTGRQAFERYVEAESLLFNRELAVEIRSLGSSRGSLGSAGGVL